MQVIRKLDDLAVPCKDGTAMTIGVFDAIHPGHQSLINRAREEAKLLGVKSLVFTFERHPLATLAPPHCPPAILQPAKKIELIEALGVDLCLVLPFTQKFARTTADAFVNEILIGRCHVRFIICGNNFSFGSGAKGTPKFLADQGRTHGFEVEVLDPVTHGQTLISSSRVRDALLQGRVAEAVELLGRPYAFSATVITGHQRGRTIGFPTANLQPANDQLIPADGVYAVRVRVPGENELMRGGMMNIGGRPTFEGAGRSVEVHIFDYSGELVGQSLEVEFVGRVRDEMKFSSVERLVSQIKIDEGVSRRILAG